MKKVLLIGPAPTEKGGISSIISKILSINKLDRNNLFVIQNISSYGKNKILSFFTGLLVYLIKVYFTKVDLVHFHMSSNGSFYRKYIFYTLTPKKTKFAVHIHSGKFINFYELHSVWMKKKIAKMLRDSEKIIMITNFQKKELCTSLDITEDRIRQIYNGIEVNNVGNDLEYTSKEKTVVSFMGKLSREKGFEDFVHLSYLNKDNDNLIFCVAGDDYLGNLKFKIENDDRYSNISYFGWLNGKGKEDFLVKTDLFISPSYHEAFGLSTIEAMNYYCIPIAYKVGGLEEIIGSSNGFLINVGDVHKMNEIINNLALEDKLKMKKMKERAHRRSLHFSNDLFNENILKLYEEIVETK